MTTYSFHLTCSRLVFPILISPVFLFLFFFNSFRSLFNGFSGRPLDGSVEGYPTDILLDGTRSRNACGELRAEKLCKCLLTPRGQAESSAESEPVLSRPKFLTLWKSLEACRNSRTVYAPVARVTTEPRALHALIYMYIIHVYYCYFFREPEYFYLRITRSDTKTNLRFAQGKKKKQVFKNKPMVNFVFRGRSARMTRVLIDL